MRAYGAVWAVRAARWPLLTSTITRITPGMMVLALVLMVRDAGQGYAVAGAVTAAHQLGVGLGSPVQGRLVDRLGQRAVVIPDGPLYLTGASLLVVLAGRGAPTFTLMAAALLTGLVYPPVTACSRVLLSGLFPTGQQRASAFAVSAISVELGFILGPLVAVVVRERWSAATAVVVAALIAAIGAIGYASSGAVGVVRRGPRPTGGRAGALRSAGVVTMVMALGLLAVAFGVIDIVVPAAAEHAGRPSAAGALIASIAGGSLLGGLLYGARPWPGSAVARLRVLSAGFTAGLVALPMTVGSLTSFAAGLLLAGLLLGPTTIVSFQLIDDLALPGTQTEAQAWTQSSVVAGVALGAALTGLMVDHRGPAAAITAGAVAVAGAAVLVNLHRDRLVPPPRPVRVLRPPGTG